MATSRGPRAPGFGTTKDPLVWALPAVGLSMLLAALTSGNRLLYIALVLAVVGATAVKAAHR